jgi:tetratricopeptide (TPR) repeat protein
LPALAQDQDLVAGLCQMLGDFDQALEYKTEAVANWEAVLGPEHYLISAHLNQLGVLFQKLGRNDDAVATVRSGVFVWDDTGSFMNDDERRPAMRGGPNEITRLSLIINPILDTNSSSLSTF